MRKFLLLFLIITGIYKVFGIAANGAETPSLPVAFFLPAADTTDTLYRGEDVIRQIRQEIPSSALNTGNMLGLQDSVEYDPVSKRYIVKPLIGDRYYYSPPYSVSLQDYLDYQNKVSLYSYNRQKSRQGEQYDFKELVSQIQFLDNILNPIFGNTDIKLNMQGSVELTLGVKTNKVDNPTLPVDLRKNTTLDFDEKIQFNINGGIGDLVNLDWSYNTEATFDFENVLKLNYEGKEDDIIKKIEAGNVSLPLPGTLISGGRDLWGFRADLQFGKLTVSSIFSQQKSEANVIQLDKGGQKQEFEMSALNYEANKHFFLSQYFRETYDRALEKLPVVNSGVRINKIEVWITNKTSRFEKARNILAFTDLAELAGSISNPAFNPQAGVNMPQNESNDLYRRMRSYEPQGIRDINLVTSILTQNFGQNFLSGRDYEKIENARLLDPSEYVLNDQLGYISLNQALNADEVLAVAYEYSYRGEIFTVGELTAEAPTAPSSLMVKMLKGTTHSPRMPTWDLMMKNVYNIGSYGLSPEDFVLDILYQNDKVGTKVNYLPAQGIENQILLSVLNLDRLNSQLDASPDGKFDYIEGITVYSNKGRIVFPVLEPFGRNLRNKITSPADADQFAYDSLYTQTQSDAEKQTQKNKFYLKGSYKSSTSSEISLGSFNVAEGSVSVVANGVELIENIDYIVDYASGTLQILNQGILASGTPITVKSENRSVYGMQTRSLVGTHLDYRFNEKFNLGATIMYMNEKPLTHKVNIGEEPISNLIWGLNASYNTESGFLTNLVDKLPFINTKAKSSISIDGEFAHFTPGTSKGAGGNAYIDDFEGSKISIDMKTVTQWKLASTPHNFIESSQGGRISGYNRARLAWYVIDPLFYRMSNATPGHIRADKEQRSNHYVREIRQTEIFPKRDVVVGEVNIIPALTLSYYPEEKGPYNFDILPTPYSQGVNQDGKLNAPETRWGGIMRAVQTNDFEAANVQYLEMWILDPFIYNKEHKGGELLIDLGSISEDILRDGRKSFENGLPTSAVVNNVDTTVWGRVPSIQSIVNGFDNNDQARRFQDVGLDGLSDEEEREYFREYLETIKSIYGEHSIVYQDAYNDPSGDNYHYFRGSDYDEQEVNILDRYKYFNGTEGNSPTTSMSRESYPTAATSLPDVEDINGDNTLNETESFYRYKLSVTPQDFQNPGSNFITNVTTATVDLPNGTVDTVRWYQIKIPLNTNDREAYGGINDLKSVRFMRMLLTGFEEDVVMRFATLEFVRDNWRKMEGQIDDRTHISDNTIFDISAVSLEENGSKTPVNYVMPPGIERVVDVTNPQYKQLNEQAMLLKVLDLEGEDARAVYKNVNYDMLRYKTLKMDVHAEAVEGHTLEDEELTLFLRIGSDHTNNYYEYEIPLYITPPGYYIDENEIHRQLVWPAKNRIELPLRLLQILKQKRNTFYRENGREWDMEVFRMKVAELDGGVNPDIREHVLKVKGRPTLGEIRTIMIGIRNPNELPSEKRAAEIWVNELRLSDFDTEGGWAANVRMTTKLADLATLTFAGSRITPGFGSIEQSISEISRDDYKSLDFSANVEFGKFFPERWGVRIPMYYAFSQQSTLPEYDPLDTDIPLDIAMDNAGSKRARDSIKRNAEDFRMRKSLNFTNIGINTNKEKSRILDISNLSLTYSFNKEYGRNVNTERDLRKDHRGLVSYIYNGAPELKEPFKNKKSLSSPYLKLIRDFNFYYLPTMLSFTSDMYRNYSEVLSKNLDNPNLLILPTVDKDFIWQRDYAFKFNLTRNLSLDFRASARARIDEPEGIVDKERDPERYEQWKDTVWHNILDGGRPVNYNHNAEITYRVPIDKLPGLDWTNLQTMYAARYDWEAMPLTNDSTNLGNTIRNSNSIQASFGMNLSSLYNKSKWIRSVTRPTRNVRGKPVAYNTGVENVKRNQSFVVTHNLKTKDIRVVMRGADGKPIKAGYETVGNNKVRITSTESIEKATVAVTGTAAPESSVNGFTRFGVGVLTSIKNIRVSYSENNSSTLPGFLPEARWLGQQSVAGRSAPGFSFLFGGQSETFGIRSAEKGWITTDTTLNSPFMMNRNQNITITSLIEPVKKLRIDLRAERSRSRDMNEYLWYNGSAFSEMNKIYGGNFSMSMIALNSAFNKIGNDVEASAGVYRKFLEKRSEVSRELAVKRFGDAYSGYEIVTEDGINTGFYEGYGETSQQVLISAFNRAYGVGDHDGIIPKFLAMRPNWRVTYTGITDIPFMKKLFNSFNISHSYRCRYNVGSYNSNLKFQGEDGLATNMDMQGNWWSEFDVNTISISEEFNPLFNMDMSWINNITSRFSLIRRRDIALSLTNSQITETASNEIIIGAGYRFASLPIFMKNKQLDNDINLMCDFSIRKNNTIIRRISEYSDQLTAGQKVMSINVSADYTFNNRFNMRLFYDRVVNTPYVSLSFPTANTHFGVSVRFSLTQ